MIAGILVLASCAAASLADAPAPPQNPVQHTIQALCTAYRSHLTPVDGAILWTDGTRMSVDDGRTKTFQQKLNDPDLEDQFSIPYPKNEFDTPPSPNEDPGRIRFVPFFEKLYGGTREEVSANLISVAWLPGAQPETIMFNKQAGAAAALAEVARDLARLPEKTQAYVLKPLGSFNWRAIAGTQRPSPHRFGIAVDFQLPTKLHCYWQWSGKSENSPPPYPPSLLADPRLRDIVGLFEKHGFIWGGKWAHFDSMHFEFRPELLQKP